MASETKILHSIVRVAPVYCIIDYELDLSNQTVMRSCYKPGKILLNALWERTFPEGRRILKAKLSKRATKCVAVIRPQSLPSAVFPNIGYYITRVIS